MLIAVQALRFIGSERVKPQTYMSRMCTAFILALLVSCSISVGPDVPANSHIHIAPAPPGIMEASAFVHQGKGYLFGGNKYAVDTKEKNFNISGFENYYRLDDPRTFQWTTLSPKGFYPPARKGACMVNKGPKAYMYGGYVAARSPWLPQTDDNLYVFDLELQSWSIAPNKGQMKPNMRQGHSCGLVGNVLIVAGGESITGSIYFGDTWIFDLDQSIWIQASTGTTGFNRAYAGSFIYNNTFHLIGGATSASTASSDVYSFDLEIGLWTKVKTLDTKFRVSRQLTAVIEDTLWTYGGIDGAKKLVGSEINGFNLRNDFELVTLDPVPQYNQIPYSSPPPNYSGYCFVFDRDLFLGGGAARPKDNINDDAWVWNAELKRYVSSSLNYYPLARKNFGISRIDDETFLIFGGKVWRIQKPLLNDVWTFSIRTMKWTLIIRESTAPGVPEGRQDTPISYLDGNFYIFGGSTSGAVDTNIWRFNIAEKKWYIVPSTSLEYPIGARMDHAVATISSSAYLFAGQTRNPNDKMEIVYKLDLSPSFISSSFQVPPGTIPPIVKNARAVSLNGKGYWYGGLTPSSVYMNKIWEFDPDSYTWTELIPKNPELAPQLLDFSFATGGDYLYTYGGKDPNGMNSNTTVFQLSTRTWIRMSPKFPRPDMDGHMGVVLGKYFIVYGGSTDLAYLSDLFAYVLAFCHLQTIISAPPINQYYSISDGSGEGLYMPETNCVWKVEEASHIYVKNVGLAVGDSILIHEGLNGSFGPQLASLDSKSASGLFIKGSGNGFTITFTSDAGPEVSTGFDFDLYNCPQGAVVDLTSSKCICPSETYRSVSQACIPCPEGYAQTKIDQNMCEPKAEIKIPKAPYGQAEKVISYPPPIIGGFMTEISGSIVLGGGRHGKSISDHHEFRTLYVSEGYIGSWSVSASSGQIPSIRSGYCYAGKEGVMIFGGSLAESSLPTSTEQLFSDLYEMDSRLIWKKIVTQSSPSPRKHSNCALSSGSFYVAGGVSIQNLLLSDIWVYERSTGVWRQLSSVGSGGIPVHSGHATVINSLLYVVGGFQTNSLSVTIFSFNIVTSELKQTALKLKSECSADTCFLGRSQSQLAVSGRNIILIGGLSVMANALVVTQDILSINVDSGDTEYKNSNYQTDLSVSLLDNPPPRYGAATTVVDEILYIVGGAQAVESCYSSDVWTFNLKTLSYQESSVTLSPLARIGSASTLLDRDYYQFGGEICRGSATNLLNDLWVLDTDKMLWTLLSRESSSDDRPSPRSLATLVGSGNRLYLIGGHMSKQESSTLIWVYSIASKTWGTQAFQLVDRAYNPNFRNMMASVTLQNKTYIWGGRFGSTSKRDSGLSSILIFDPSKSTFQGLPEIGTVPQARWGSFGFNYNNKPCFFGGDNTQTKGIADISCLNLKNYDWSLISSNATVGPKFESFSAYSDTKRLFTTGIALTSKAQQSWMFDFGTQSWVKLPTSSTVGSENMVWFTIGNSVFSVGGGVRGAPINSIQSHSFGFCNSHLKVDAKAFQAQLSDGSASLPYLPESFCRWEIRQYNNIEIKIFDVLPSDRVTIYEDINFESETAYLNFQKKRVLSPSDVGKIIQSAGDGFVIEFNSTADSPGADGFEFKLFHCGQGSTYAKTQDNSAGSCKCAKGYYHENQQDPCKQCSKEISHTDCIGLFDESEDETGVIIGASVGGAGFFALGAVMLAMYRRTLHRKAMEKSQHVAGQISFEELSFDKLIGRGQFGEVFKGSYKGTEVAIKKLLSDGLNSAALEEFMSEVLMMVELRHPNIVLYMGACVKKPSLCIVSELMTRGSLYDVLHDESVDIDESMKIGFVIDTVKGMQYLHLSNPPILHRDMKSLNLLLDEKWNLKISDFGLTAVKGGKNKADQGPPGTLLWMAPEVIMGQEYTEKADVYSFAIIMWEIYTRKEPYQGEEMAISVATRVATDNIRPQIPPEDIMSSDLQQVMIKAWDKDPIRRPSFHDMLKDINTVYNSKSMSYSTSSSFSMTKTSTEKKDKAPVGTVALVFTDVQGSTALWEAHAEDMAVALAMHNDVMRGVIRKNGGYEVKTEGDAFMVSFTSARQASAFCLQAQELLLGLDWPQKILEHPAGAPETAGSALIFRGLRVRMGIHLGDPLCKQDPVTGRMDYFGKVVNRAARVGGYGKGGQIIISENAHQSIQEHISSLGSPAIRDLGMKELKGLNTQEHLFEMLPSSLSDRSIRFSGELESNASSQIIGFIPADEDEVVALPKETSSWHVNFADVGVNGEAIGSGSYGAVYLGSYQGRRVAVKKFLKQKMAEKQYFSFLAEVMLLKDLSHPSILSFFGACIKPPNLCLLLEHATHGNLSEVLKNQNISMSTQDKKKILYQISDAMAYLHSHSPPIIHRDLKSPNILVSDIDGFVVKLCDFGLARVKSDNQTMTRCGTGAWIAPEVLKGARYGEKADIYSFGIVCWEVVARQRPYANMDPLKLTAEVVKGLRPIIPANSAIILSDLMQTCWSANESDRPSFAEIKSTLE